MAHQTQEYVGIALWISSNDLSPDVITQAVGFEPSYVQVRGTAIKGVTRLYERHGWKFGERLYAEQGNDIGELSKRLFDNFLRKVKSAIPAIRDLSTSNEVSIAIIYNVYDMPFIGFNCEQIQVIAAMGASVNFDVMVSRCASEGDADD